MRISDWSSDVCSSDLRPGASAHLLRPCLPRGDKLFIGVFGLPGDLYLLIAQRLDVIGMGRAGLVPLFLRPASLEFHRPALVREQRRSCPAIVGLFGEEMPAQDRQLAGEGDRGDLVAAFCSDSEEEGMQRPWRLGDRTGGVRGKGVWVSVELEGCGTI